MTERDDADEEHVSTIIQTTKPAQVRRYLSKPPRGAARLALIASVDGGMNHQLGAWAIDEAKPELAELILDIMREHCEELQGEVMATLRWESASCAQLGGIKVVKAYPQRPPNVSFGSTPEELNGTSNSLVVQAQKHTEVTLRMMIQNMSSVLHQSRELSEQAMELARDHSRARAEAEERAEAMKRERDDALSVVTAMQEADTEGNGETAVAQGQIMKLLENPVVVQHIMTRLMGGGAPPAGNAPPH